MDLAATTCEHLIKPYKHGEGLLLMAVSTPMSPNQICRIQPRQAANLSAPNSSVHGPIQALGKSGR